jgi:ATP synthase protein I
VKGPETDRRQSPRLVVSAARYFALGLEMAFSVLIGFAVGHLLDRELHSLPWFTLGFTLLGIVAAFMDVYRAVRNLSRDEVTRPKL